MKKKYTIIKKGTIFASNNVLNKISYGHEKIIICYDGGIIAVCNFV